VIGGVSRPANWGTLCILREVGPNYLSDAETDLIGQCLKAAVDGPFFPDWEFHSLVGLERSEVAEVSDEWPSTSDGARQRVAVGNVLNNLLGYPVDHEEQWSVFISYGRDEVTSAFSLWRAGAEPKLDT
jgi:hypothetical protein